MKKIGDGITDASHFGIILSRNSIQSRWCEVELHEALNIEISSGKNRIIPILAAETQLPSFLKGRHYINLLKGYNAGLLRIAGKISNVSSKDIDIALSGVHRLNRRKMLSIWLEATRDSRRLFGEKDWLELTSILERHDIDIESDIEILDLWSGRKFLAS